MFLITTADQRFWKKDKPVLFLGEWCKLYSEKHIWEKLDFEVLPYHWDDRKKLFADYQYLQRLYERVFTDLSRCLNTIHGEERSVRYWRIIIGPWLHYFIQVFYDRYACIERAAQSGKVTDTIIGSYPAGAWIPKGYDNFNQLVIGDEYNFFLYSWLVKRMQPFSFQSQPVTEGPVVSVIEKEKSWLSRCLKGIILLYERILPHRFNKYSFISSYLSRKDLWYLQLSLGQWPSIFAPQVDLPNCNVNMGLREKILLSAKYGYFEELLSEIIGKQIPWSYLEGYAVLKKQSMASYPTRPKLVLTANAFYSNESFKFWSAEQADRGIQLAGVQHGGLYGSALFYACEEHEIKVCDVYYTWGWKPVDFNNTKPLAAAKFNSIRSLRSKLNGKILMPLMALPRYSYHLYSVPVGATGMLSYFEDQFRFVDFLSSDAKKALLVRLFMHDFDWIQQARWMDRFPGLEYDLAKVPMGRRLGDCRLFIGTYNSTTYLESFKANIPTVLFWNQHQWELRGSAESYFDRLREVGILHDTPESASKKVNEIFLDPADWWQRDVIQKAKNNFCERFAKTSDDWLREWRQELFQLAHECPKGKSA